MSAHLIDARLADASPSRALAALPGRSSMWKRILLAALLATAFVSRAVAVEPVDAADKIKLRVLYAGVPGDARTADFVAFLEKHFTKVGQAGYSQFQPKMADDYDVVIFDA